MSLMCLKLLPSVYFRTSSPMTSWSLKKKSTGNSESESCPCLRVFQGFLEFIKKKAKAQILDVDRNHHRKSMYWEVTQQKKLLSSTYLLHIFTPHKVFLMTPQQTQKLRKETERQGASGPATSPCPERAEFYCLPVEEFRPAGHCRNPKCSDYQLL